MNTYSRALRHIDMNDVKRRREENIAKQKIVEEVTKNIVKEVREELRNLNNPEFSNWRWDLNEGMTTAALSTTTLPATGDTDISQVDGYESIFATNGGTLSGTDLSYSVRDTDSVTFVSGATNTYSRSATTNAIDTTRITQIKFSVSKTAQPLGVDSWTDAGNSQSYNDNISISMYSPNLPLDDATTFTTNATTGDYTFDIPKVLRGRTDVAITFTQNALASLPGEPTTGTAAAIFYTPTFQRTVPVTLAVSLDDPEASAFIRTEPTTSNLSPAQKEKRLKEMIAASDEYLTKMFGDKFPGTGAVAPKEVAMPQSWQQDVSTGKQSANTDTQIAGLPPGPKGYEPPSSYDSRRFVPIQSPGSNWGNTPAYNLIDPLKGLEPTGPGLSKQSNQNTQVASARGPYGTPGADKPYTRKGYKDKDGKFVDFDNPATWPKIPKAQNRNSRLLAMVAHHEPQGQVLSEKKLKSPKEILNKIPGYYDGKPAPLGFPETPPPEMKNGMHPDLVDGKNVANRFNRLDPISAKAMPLTGNPHIDKKVKAARKKPK